MEQPVRRPNLNSVGLLKQVLTPGELRDLTRPSDWRGALSVGITWATIAGAMAAVVLWPHVLTVSLCLILVGGRQLALSVLMHEASHRSLFRSRRLNQVVGQWLCAYPTWNDVTRYRRHHLRHHWYTGTDADPDLALVEPFPTSRASLARKLTRDLLGIAGLKRIVGLLLIDLGYLEYNVSGSARRLDQSGRTVGEVLRTGARNLAGPAAVHAVAVTGLWLADLMVCYALWWIAYATTFSLFLRVRSIAEHACTARVTDPLRNTRTTRASWLARLTVAPHDVNHHLEHHLLVSVPHYRLARMHRLLRARGALVGAPLAGSYLEVLSLASSARPRLARGGLG